VCQRRAANTPGSGHYCFRRNSIPRRSNLDTNQMGLPGPNPKLGCLAWRLGAVASRCNEKTCLFVRFSRPARSLARSPVQHMQAGILVPVSPLVRSLALHSIARPLSDCHTPMHWFRCASRSVCCVTLARSLAIRSIARSLLARLLVLCSLARSLAVAQPYAGTLVSPVPQRALQRGHPQQTATAMSMLLSRPPWWVCGGDPDARHLPISAIYQAPILDQILFWTTFSSF